VPAPFGLLARLLERFGDLEAPFGQQLPASGQQEAVTFDGRLDA
jgi:hypothetical protein